MSTAGRADIITDRTEILKQEVGEKKIKEEKRLEERGDQEMARTERKIPQKSDEKDPGYKIFKDQKKKI
jgi:hypothetical protein